MGRGDKKTRRGKIGIGTFGRLRPRKKNKVTAGTTAKAKPAAKATPKTKPATKKPAKKAAEEEE